jgi:trans-aconitate 2-methyltransferase
MTGGMIRSVSDWDGVAYRRVNNLQQWLADRALDDLDLDGVQSLLDVGCGDGRITAQIAERIPDAEIVGIDPSPRMIAIAPAQPQITFQVGDVLGLQFEDRFDAVVSFNALHWVPDQRTALSRIARAVHPRGWALLVFVCAAQRPSIEGIAMDVAATPQWREYFAGFDAPFVHPLPADFQATAAECGLKTDELIVDDLAWDFGTTESFRAWCAVGSGAWTSRVPDGRSTEFVDDMVDAYALATGSDQVFRFMQLRARLVRD